jgi:hypothetical protein
MWADLWGRPSATEGGAVISTAPLHRRCRRVRPDRDYASVAAGSFEARHPHQALHLATWHRTCLRVFPVGVLAAQLGARPFGLRKGPLELLRAGARPATAVIVALIDAHKKRFGSSRSAGCSPRMTAESPRPPTTTATPGPPRPGRYATRWCLPLCVGFMVIRRSGGPNRFTAAFNDKSLSCCGPRRPGARPAL